MSRRVVAVDARGLRCPWPVLRLVRAAREGADEVRLTTDDPAAPQEVAALAAERGWQVVQDGEILILSIVST